MNLAPSTVRLLLVFAMAVAWYLGIHSPLAERAEVAAGTLAAARTRLLAARRLAGMQEEVEPLLRQASPGVLLVAKLEARLQAGGLKDRMVQMHTIPVKRDREGRSRAKDSAYLRLDRLDLQQVMAALGELERLDRSLWVRKVDLKLLGEREAMLEVEVDELITE